jgi:hypothetical protein
LKLDSHLAELKKRHAALEKSVRALQRSPGSDSLHISRLKKEKLRLKEEMRRLKNVNHLTVASVPAQTLENLEDDPGPTLDSVTMSDETDADAIDIAA